MLSKKLAKLKTRVTFTLRDWRAEKMLAKTYSGNPDLVWARSFPLLESEALQTKCDYSFGDHSGVVGHVPGAYMKKANASNTEFAEAVRAHTGPVMSLFIDNVRLYRRPLPFRDWLKMKPTLILN